MGRTILSGRAAATILAPAASNAATNFPTMYVALFDRTRSSNVSPSVPEWHCIWFGTYADSLAALVRMSESCAGGMLCSEYGQLTPEGNLREWRKRLVDPALLRATSIRLENRPRVNCDAVKAVMDKHRVVTTVPGTTTLQLEHLGHAAALAEMVARHEETGVRPFELFPYVTSFYAPKPGPGWLPEERTAPIERRREEAHRIQAEVDVWRVPLTASMKLAAAANGFEADHDHVIVTPNSGARMSGWEYSTIQAFMRDVVREAEATTPGIAETLLRIIRAKLAASKDLPMDTRLTLRAGISASESEYCRREFEKLASALGHPAVSEFEVTVGEIVKAEKTRHLGSLSPDQVSFHGLAPHGQPSSTGATAQGDLLAA